MADIQALAESTLGRAERFSVKAEIKRADEVIDPGETVEMLAVGSYKGSGNSLVILTDTRLIVLNETGAFAKKLHVHDMLHRRVSNVRTESGRVHGKLTLSSSGDDMEIDRILPTGRSDEIARAIRARL